MGRKSLLLWGCLLVCAHGGVALAAQPAHRGPFAVGEIAIRFIDSSRLVTFPGHRPEPRPLETVIRYPALGSSSQVDVRDAPPARADGPFPMIVFAHGFNVTPLTYASLLQAWARAGYVVAAPVFPLTNANAPGGANESDLVNQPGDMSFVITELLARDRDRYSILAGLIRQDEIAVSGQSDGGSTALAVAYDRRFVDHRIGAAMILSGAEIPGVGGYDFPAPSPPLLAVQGTADTSNAPASTYHYFDRAPQPKFMLSLRGAGHLPPYTTERPQLTIVERETIAFVDRYLKQIPGSRSRMWTAGKVPGIATLRN